MNRPILCIWSSIIVLGCLTFLIQCKKIDSDTSSSPTEVLHLPNVPFDYSGFVSDSIHLNGTLQYHNNTPQDNPITPWGATLGRVLFYDKALSKNNTVACSSCHIQQFGFSDTAVLSVGFEGGVTNRHSMGLSNAAFYSDGRFFWDERAATLEEQVLMPIQDPIEMGMSLDSLVLKLQTLSYYPKLFEKAFGSDEIDTIRIAKALAQFVRSIASSNTKFDKGMNLAQQNRNAPFPNFSPSENLGKDIYFNHSTIKCGSCHFTRGFILDNPRNNGTRDGDFGVFFVYENPIYIGAFKSPSLINVAKRPPYMHNGSLPTLEDVVEHYNSGLNNDDGRLDPHLVDPEGNALKMNLNPAEKQALIDFLHTLNDDHILSHEAYSNPFQITSP